MMRSGLPMLYSQTTSFRGQSAWDSLEIAKRKVKKKKNRGSRERSRYATSQHIFSPTFFFCRYCRNGSTCASIVVSLGRCFPKCISCVPSISSKGIKTHIHSPQKTIIYPRSCSMQEYSLYLPCVYVHSVNAYILCIQKGFPKVCKQQQD